MQLEKNLKIVTGASVINNGILRPAGWVLAVIGEGDPARGWYALIREKDAVMQDGLDVRQIERIAGAVEIRVVTEAMEAEAEKKARQHKATMAKAQAPEAPEAEKGEQESGGAGGGEGDGKVDPPAAKTVGKKGGGKTKI